VSLSILKQKDVSLIIKGEQERGECINESEKRGECINESERWYFSSAELCSELYCTPVEVQ
jgi:hypothetical protein